MKTLQLKPVIESIECGYQAKASLYQDNFHCATESFNAYDDKQEAWNNAKESSVNFIKNHNNNCKCGVKMTLGSF